ncbi:transposase [Streptomyces acidicola]|uniref:Transposase n=1 Tax=Streptomyces acidicola TaxID=2596892 RepID=A0A5N8WK03_9ACTN|nr:transposase [Streptomyces acidicola]
MGVGRAVAAAGEGGAEGGTGRSKHPPRQIVDAIFYVVRTGCAWRQLPKDFAPRPTVYWHFTWWHDNGTVERIHGTLRSRLREADGRSSESSAGLPARPQDACPGAMTRQNASTVPA